MSLEIKYVKQSWLANEPKMATFGSAGYDLFPAEDRVIEPLSPGPVCVHLEMEIPPRHYGRIFLRSSLARYHFIDVGGGVIDSDFRGKLIVILFNHSNKPYEVRENDGIAQIIFQRYETVKFVECSKLSQSDRGKGAFGSTGI